MNVQAGNFVMVELRVLSGLHQGAALPLVGDRWGIGAHEDADLALYDPGIEPRHAELQCIEGKWRVQAQAGLVEDDAGNTAAQIADLLPGAEFSISGIRLCVINADCPWPEAPVDTPSARAAVAVDDLSTVDRPRWKKPLMGVLTVLALAFTGLACWPVSEAPATLEPPVIDGKSRLETSREVQQQLFRMLSERELASVIRLELANHQVALRGDVLRAQLPLVSRMLDRFQAQFDTSIKVINSVQEISPDLPFKIVQIIGGKKAHVVLADGRRMFFGDEVEGLRLTFIDNHRLLFEGKRHYEVRW